MCGGMSRKDKMRAAILNTAYENGHKPGRFHWDEEGSSAFCQYCGGRFSLLYPDTPDTVEGLKEKIIYTKEARGVCQENLYRLDPGKVKKNW
jgi:hypothetical protein